MSKFGNLFSVAIRERCVTNMANKKVPTQWKESRPDAAVLIPLCQVNGVPSLLYTVRAATLRSHGGQISFPGGKINKGETAVACALRETHEEIGIDPQRVDVWGCGNTIAGRNNQIMIKPVVGAIQDLRKEDMNINRNEVTEVFAVPLDTLCETKNQYYTQFKNGFILPVFVADDYKIWGITAYLTHMFLESLLPPDIYMNDWVNKKVKVRDVSIPDNM